MPHAYEKPASAAMERSVGRAHPGWSAGDRQKASADRGRRAVPVTPWSEGTSTTSSVWPLVVVAPGAPRTSFMLDRPSPRFPPCAPGYPTTAYSSVVVPRVDVHARD